MPLFSITNLITYRQLSHGSNYRSAKPCSRSREGGGKRSAYTQTDPNQQHQKKESGDDVGKYLKTPGGKLSPPKKISDNLQGNRIYVFEKGSFCCISVALDLTTGLLLGDVLKVNQTSHRTTTTTSHPFASPLPPPHPPVERREAHSSIGNLKMPGDGSREWGEDDVRASLAATVQRRLFP